VSSEVLDQAEVPAICTDCGNTDRMGFYTEGFSEGEFIGENT